MKHKELMKRYDDYEDKVKEYMELISKELVKKNGDDILAGNLVIMTKAIQNISTDADGIVGKDNYRGEKKSTSLSAFLAAQTNVIKILNSFGWTPAGASKIRSSQQEVNIKEAIEALTA